MVKRERQKFITVMDVLVTILFASMYISNRMHGDSVSWILFDRLYLLFTGYFIFRFLLCLNARIFDSMIVFAVQIWAIVEAGKGFMQIIGVLTSNNELFVCTGSFNNPGPYGGFLAMAASVSFASILGYGRDSAGYGYEILYFRIQRFVSYVCLLLCLILIPSTQSRAALVALAACGVLYVCTDGRARSFAGKYLFVPVIIIVSVVILVTVFKRQSAGGRMFISRMNCKTMLDNGLRGVGSGHYPEAYGKTQIAYFRDRISFADGKLIYEATGKDRLRADNPNAAFNDYLQIGIEYGLWTMLLFIASFLTALCNMVSIRSPLSSGLVAMLVFALFSYPLSLWQFQVLSVAFLASGSIRNDCERSTGGLALTLSMTLIMLLVSLPKAGGMVKRYNAEKQWEDERYLFSVGDYGSYEYCCSQLYPEMIHNYPFLYEYAYSQFMNGKLLQSEENVERAMRLCCNSLLFNLLGDIHKAQGKLDEAERDYMNAFYVLPDRLYPLSRLARLYYDKGDTVKLQNMVECIRGFRPRVESASTMQIRKQVDELADGIEWPDDYPLVCE